MSKAARTPEAQYARHIEALRRREKYLANKEDKNSFDKAEQSALDWVLHFTTYTREDQARAIDSVESHKLIKNLRG